MNAPHVPVLHDAVVKAFERCTGKLIDCTLGYAGHSALLLEADPALQLVGIDRDETAIDFATTRLAPFGDRVSIRRGAFSDLLPGILNEPGRVCGVLADIGVSSLQLDNRARGFSYESDVLDMRMDQRSAKTAADVVNSYTQPDLERILRDYGEIRNAARIAAEIVTHRPFHSARELSDRVKPFAPRGKKIHPATLVMQAIRIEVNDELGELERMLDTLQTTPLPGARIGVITFHSLEDRIVKQRFARWSKSCICPPEAPRCICGNDHALGRTVTKKPIIADEAELRANPRSRSAKLRLFDMSPHE